MKICGIDVEVISLNSVVVGSGAAGFNAIDKLYTLGQTDVALVTEGVNMGTSRNTGSDKQTYYKLTLAGDQEDSVGQMAQTLFSGGAMHGDLALCEAALSSQAFFRLVEYGVPFPHNRYGEYVGYKTDHDPRQRATSCGPLTSKMMTEKLHEQVVRKGIKIYDGYKVIEILTKDGKAIGLLCLNKNAKEDSRFVLFNCKNIVYATGGPAGMYSHSVYPPSQTGATGTAFRAGVAGCNLTEWQYGIASIKFRWNLSGTYQQVLPRYISTDKQGGDSKEFLNEYFEDKGKLLDCVFLKGYQWPFDPRKIENYGSSIIDILVYNEIEMKGRRVFLDFLENPSALQSDFGNLGEEGRQYLENSNALFGTPIERLAKMNQPAIDLYKNNGIDLTEEMLEIAVCAQHNNGGLAVNCWWETNIGHLFAVGEVAGTHGVYRPGGSALNSGQVASARAATFIAARYTGKPMEVEEFESHVKQRTEQVLELARALESNKQGIGCHQMRKQLGDMTSANAAHIRSEQSLSRLIEYAKEKLDNVKTSMVLERTEDLVTAFENIDLMVCQLVYGQAMLDYLKKGGKSRGSFLVHDREGMKPLENIPDEFRFSVDDGKLNNVVQNVEYRQNECCIEWQTVRPIPQGDYWFENVWNDYNAGKIIDSGSVH